MEFRIRTRISVNGVTVNSTDYRTKALEQIEVQYAKLQSALAPKFVFHLETEDEQVVWVGRGQYVAAGAK